MNGRCSVKLEENLALSRLVTPYQSRRFPIYRWYNLNHSYSRDLVLFLLQEFEIGPGKLVLDPFCGSGTTLLACREKGIRCFGLDMMPISPFVTRGKLLNYCAEKILNDFQQIFPAKQYDFGFEVAAEYLHKCFPHQQLTKLLHLRYSIMQMSDPARTFFIIALLNILKRISFTKNDGAFLRFKTNVTPETLEETFPPQVKMMLEDLLPVSDFYYCPSVVRADARRIPLKDNTIDGVITSPPYLNRHDYTRIYALELLFNFLQDNEELKRLRYKMLRSNVEARRTVNILHYQPPARLEKLIAKLRASQLPNRKVIDMVWGYFEDMYGVLNELYRVLKPGALMAFVVGNCKYGGIMFPVDELLREIGENLGFKTLKIIVARYRGNAPQQMKKFGKESARESIVIWEKEK